MSECVFCNIHGLNTRIIYQNDKILVILSNPALAFGHILIIPKRHIEKINQLTKDEIEEIFIQLVKFENILLKKYAGADIRQNYRLFLEDSNYKVSHLHFHLIPRTNEDELYKKSMIFEKQIFRFLESEELEKIKMEIFENAN